MCLRVQLGASCELTWERIVKQARSVSLAATGSVHESEVGSVLDSVLRAWERAKKCIWQCVKCSMMYSIEPT